jgi:DNA-binding SARP family transcriptional activator/TolB-like protein
MTAPIQFHCLGAVRLLDHAGRPLDAVLAQPKRLGLFAYMLLAEPEPKQSRDALLGIFWPESPESDARAALRQALSYLRREVGPDLILSKGRGWVGIDCDRVSCDLWELEAHLERGERAAALERYRGELLQGFELRGAPEFDRWLISRRAALARRMATLAGELAEEARDRDDGARALLMARRALEIRPAGEEELRRLMGMQLWAGDRAGALRTYERFERWLADEYQAQPSARTRDLAERARGPAPPPSDGEAPAHAGPPTASAPAAEAPAEAPVEPEEDGEDVEDVEDAPRSGRPATLRLAVVVLGVVAFVSALALVARWQSTAGATTGVEQVLILPFDVRSTDPGLAGLRGEMSDVVASVFTGRPGPRAVINTGSPATPPVSDDELVRQAAQAGARWVVTGEVFGDDRRVLLQASLVDVTGSRPPAHASLTGSADSVYTIARRLGNGLLALAAGIPESEAFRLAYATPDALRSYLLGRDAYSAGRYEDADQHFRAALRHDSVFSRAAVGLVETHLGAPWLHGHVFETVLPLAFRLRHRLPSVDREIVTAVAGPAYPEVSTQGEHYRAWERAVRHAPDRASVWYQWGDALYHVGPFIGIPDHRTRAHAAFLRTLQIDSTYLLPLAHLIELAAEEGEAEKAAAYLHRLLEPGRDPGKADYLRWRVALAAEDESALRRLRARFHQLNVASMKGIVTAAQFTGEGLEDAERIALLGPIGWHSPTERLLMLETLHMYALNRGRPTVAKGAVESMAAAGTGDPRHLRLAMHDALVAAGDPVLASHAATRLAEHVRRDPVLEDRCALEAWNLWRGDTTTVSATLRGLDHEAPAASEVGDRRPLWCAAFLQGLRRLTGDEADRHEAAADLQQLVQEGIEPPGLWAEFVHLATVRALESIGDLEGALAVNRLHRSIPYALAPQLRDRGRLAALVGDTAPDDGHFRGVARWKSRAARRWPKAMGARRSSRPWTGGRGRPRARSGLAGEHGQAQQHDGGGGVARRRGVVVHLPGPHYQPLCACGGVIEEALVVVPEPFQDPSPSSRASATQRGSNVAS